MAEPDKTPLSIGEILKQTKTIALVGASHKEERPSHRVMQYLLKAGYTVYPVNPGLAGKELLGQTVYASVSEIPAQVDLVDIFRKASLVLPIVEDAIKAGAKTIWMQQQIVSEEAAALARKNGLNVVMDRCTKIEHARLQTT